MKTKELIFYEATGKQFHRFSHGQKILEAMESYAKEQNEELIRLLAATRSYVWAYDPATKQGSEDQAALLSSIDDKVSVTPKE